MALVFLFVLPLLLVPMVWWIVKRASPAPSGARMRFVAWLGLLGHLWTLPLYMVMGLVAPPAGVFVGLVLWAALLARALFLRHRHPNWLLGLPVVSVMTLLTLLFVGERLFGWAA